jgi:hypothetical protein
MVPSLFIPTSKGVRRHIPSYWLICRPERSRGICFSSALVIREHPLFNRRLMILPFDYPITGFPDYPMGTLPLHPKI